MNPIGNVFCNRCNARLLPAEMQLPEQPKPAEETPVGVKGISLPTLQTTKEGGLEPEELPDWLLELTEQSPGKPTTAPGVQEPAPVDQLPDWLSDLVDETADNAGGETPGPFAADEITSGEAPAFSELPDWFSELAADVSAPETTAPEDVAAGETADWFADLLGDETAEVAEEKIETQESALEELPDWLTDLTPEEPAAGAVADVFEMSPPPSAWEALTPTETAPSSPDLAPEPRTELPDWLLATAVPTPSDAAPASPLPEWLSKNAVESTPGQEADTQPGAGQLPAWLMKGAEPGTAPSAPRQPAPQRPAPVEIEARARPAAKAAPLPSVEPEAEPEEIAETDWLAGLYSEEEPEQPGISPVLEPEEGITPEADEAESSLPDWLMGIYNDEEVEPQAPATEIASEGAEIASDLPDWLAGIYGEEEVEPEPAVSTAEPEEVTAAGDEASGLPDWLAGIYSEEETEPSAPAFIAEPEAEEIAPETGMPDWLGGILAEEPVPPQPKAPSADEDAQPETGIPDWLAGLQTEASSVEEEQPSPFAADVSIFTETAPEEARAAPSATPDWLKGVAATEGKSTVKPSQPAFVPGEATPGELEEEEGYEEPVLEGGEIPDWLKGLSPAPAPSPVEEEAAFIERMSEDESLVRAEVPSWLQGLRPPGTGPLPPLPEMMVPGADVPPPEEGGLVRAEIPDWVQQLRPVPSAEGEAGEKPLLEPAETEGPLAGLRGVLPDGSALDMPTDYQPAPPPTIPDSVVAQAQLWQQLLEQPRSVQRPVAQHRARSGKGQAAMRLIVATILLAVTILGLLWGDVPLSQALSRPHIERFSRTIDALESEDTVIVAVEYGPAEAGEMTILAEAVIQHLAERNVGVMLVSTLPEGAGLIQGLLEPLALANRLPEGQIAYLPGSSNGVAQFLSEPAEAKMIIVLAGRAERLRWWVEQNNAAQVLPTAMVVNAATAPLATPYLETSPVTGWIAGLPDVATYQQFRGLSSRILNSQLDALMLTHWAALALLLFGLFYYLALGKKGAS